MHMMLAISDYHTFYVLLWIKNVCFSPLLSTSVMYVTPTIALSVAYARIWQVYPDPENVSPNPKLKAQPAKQRNQPGISGDDQRNNRIGYSKFLWYFEVSISSGISGSLNLIN